MRNLEQLLTPAEVADLLGLARSTIYRHISDGSIPAIRYGRGPRAQIRVDVSELRSAFLTRNRPIT